MPGKYDDVYDRLSEGKKLSPDRSRREGTLPNDKRFYAIAHVPLRAYYWLSTRVPRTYYISHYVFKNYPRLDKDDENRVRRNWRRIEIDMEDE